MKALSSPSSERMMLPCIWYLRPFTVSRLGYWVLPSSSHLPLNSGTRSDTRASSRVPLLPLMAKNISLPQMMRESSSRKAAMGSGKFIRVLFLAFSVS